MVLSVLGFSIPRYKIIVLDLLLFFNHFWKPLFNLCKFFLSLLSESDMTVDPPESGD